MSYVSVVKKYKTVALAFAMCFATSTAVAVIMIISGSDMIISVLLALDTGFAVAIAGILMALARDFRSDDGRTFAFAETISKHIPLILANQFYVLALFCHNFIIWAFSGQAIQLAGGLQYVQSYDIASFLAVLTIIPASIRFLVDAETKFYENYTIYTIALNGSGTISEIDSSRHNMTNCLYSSLGSLMQSQAVFSIIAAVIGSRVLLPALKLDNRTIEIFPVLCLGYFLAWMCFIIVTFLLYFDAQKESMIIMLMLCILTSGLTWLLLPAGQSYYGFGFASGSLLTLVYALLRLKHVLCMVDFLIYCRRRQT
jgi:uncharacterized membrane protein